MTNSSSNLRKAAILLRSLDGETAATLLAQLSAGEAAALRAAIRELGPLDPEEQADVAAEFRREKPMASEPPGRGVELAISSADDALASANSIASHRTSNKRFEFLELAPANKIASCLAREHAQTIAVVLSQLTPERAITILAALPERIQAETMERLSNLGETDAEVVTVLERELADWLKKRGAETTNRRRGRNAVASILAAADAQTRSTIVANLKIRNATLADEIEPTKQESAPTGRTPQSDEYRIVRSIARRQQVNTQLRSLLPLKAELAERADALPASESPHSDRPRMTAHASLPRIDFDQLVHLDTRMVARLLAVADPTVLALALAGSNDELVDRFCEQMPKRIAKAFRRKLRRMGPTRLSDVEAAQRVVAEIAAQQLAERRNATRPVSSVPAA
jgi:flagellar motor switch protein FliG